MERTCICCVGVEYRGNWTGQLIVPSSGQKMGPMGPPSNNIDIHCNIIRYLTMPLPVYVAQTSYMGILSMQWNQR